mmetsp:Transcript_105176/g.224671  ORF Transcript_105176/g.224671 Transcript_105176/m.224671 type:complete len:384 (-) Transcript_105176:17-1168(-)
MSHSGRSMARNHFKQSKQRPSWASVCDSSSSDTDMKLFDNDKGAALLESTRPDTGNMWMVQDVPCGAVDDRLAERSDYGDGGEVLEMPFKHSKHCQSLDSVCDSPDDNAMRRTANEPGAALLEKTWSDVSTTCTVHSFKGNRVLRGAMDNILASNNGDRTDDSEVLPMAFVHFEKRQSWDSVSDSFDDDDVLARIANNSRVAFSEKTWSVTSTMLMEQSLKGNDARSGAVNGEMSESSGGHGDGGEVLKSWDSSCNSLDDDVMRRLANVVGTALSENAWPDASTAISVHCVEGNGAPSGEMDKEFAGSSGEIFESLTRRNLEAHNMSGRSGKVPLPPPKVLPPLGSRQCGFIEDILDNLFGRRAARERRSCSSCRAWLGSTAP